jgi:NTP pyrophosphatase (non-canonical NTP hydrolase)
MDQETTNEIKRYFDVVAEGLRSDTRLLEQGLGAEILDARRHSDAVAESLRAELGAEIRDVKRHSDVVAESLRAELGAEIRDVKRHSDVVAESLRSEIRLVAEGVAGLDEKFTPEFAKVREEIGEVKSLVLVSYRNLDRRVNPS